MNHEHISHFAEANGINIHYLDYHTNEGPPMLLLHSISANARVFQGLIANGLAKNFRLIIPDLRGRGDTSHPPEGYDLETQAQDMLALLDELQIEKAVICGHSFGALLGVYMAAHYPKRVIRLIMLDAAAELNPLTPQLVTVTLSRLLHAFPDWETFINGVRKASFMGGRWDASMMPYLRHDVKEIPGSTLLLPVTNWINIAQVITHLYKIPNAVWYSWLSRIHCHTLIVRATEPFMFGQFIAEEDKVIRSAVALQNCEVITAEGNHFNMLFGIGAGQIVRALNSFLLRDRQSAAKSAPAEIS